MSKRNENRPGYKKTRVGWIPEKWECTKLGIVVDFLDGKRIPLSEKERKNRQGRYPYYGASGIIDYVDDYIFDDELILLGEDGANIIERSSPLAFIVRGKIWVNNHAHVLKPKGKNTIGFICEYLESISYIKYNTGSAQPKLNQEVCQNIPIPLPPLPEQKKIAEILSAWDRAIEQVGKLIDAKQRLKKGLMQQLLTGRMRFPEFNHETHERHEKDKGELPEGWIGRRLSSFGSFLKGKGITNSEKKESGLPCITYGEIYTKHDFVIRQFFSFIDKNVSQKSQRIQRNDILFAGSGETLDEIGKCVAYTKDIEAYAGGDVVIFRPKGVNPLYLSYSLNSDLLIRQKRKLGQGHSVVHIYSAGLKTLQVPLPSLAEQTRIAAVLSACDREIELLKKKHGKLKEQKKGLMQKLLTGEVRHPKFLKDEPGGPNNET